MSITTPNVCRVDILVGFFDPDEGPMNDPIALMAHMVSDQHPTIYVEPDQSAYLRDAGLKPRWIVTRFDPDNLDIRATASIADDDIREYFAREACYHGWFQSIEGAVWRIDTVEFTPRLAGEIFMLAAFGKDPLLETAGPAWEE